MADRGGDAADVGAERHLVAEGRGDAGLAELLVEQLQRLDAAGEHDVVVAGVGAARLHADHADDHRQVVLHPVLHLGELQPDRVEPALGDLDLARRSGCRGSRRPAPSSRIGVIVSAVEERRAVGAVVGDLDGDVLARRDRLARRRATRSGSVSGPCRKRQLRPIDRLDRVAGQPGEGGVGVDDRVVLERRGWSARARAAGPRAPSSEAGPVRVSTAVAAFMPPGRCAARCASRAGPAGCGARRCRGCGCRRGRGCRAARSPRPRRRRPGRRWRRSD